MRSNAPSIFSAGANMAAPFLSWVNYMDPAHPTATSEAVGMPAQNLSTPVISNPWRSLDTEATLTTHASFGAVDFVLLAGCNFSGASDTIQHRFYDFDGVLLHDSGAIPCGVTDGFGIHLYKLPTTLTGVVRWFCDFNIVSRESIDGTFDVGRAWVGAAFQPGIGISYGWAQGYLDNIAVNRSQYSGIAYPGDGAQWRYIDFTFDWLSDDETDQAQDLMRLIGRSKQIVFVPDPDGKWTRQAIIGKRSTMEPIKQDTAFFPAAYSHSMRIEEDK